MRDGSSVQDVERIAAPFAGLIAMLMTGALAFFTWFGAEISYTGLLSPGDPGKAALTALIGVLLTIGHGCVAVALFRGSAWARRPAQVLFVIWALCGVASLPGARGDGVAINLLVVLFPAFAVRDVVRAVRLAGER